MNKEEKILRISGEIEIIMTIPKIITLEEIETMFKEHAKNGKYYIKKIKYQGFEKNKDDE